MAAAVPSAGGAVSADRSALYSMGALTKLSAADMRLILTHYAPADGSEQYVRHCELSGGLSNSNYRLDTTQRTLLVKVCDEKPVDALLSQVEALTRLRAHKLPIAYPISRADASAPTSSSASTAPPSRSYILELPPWKPVVLYDFVHGSPPTRVTEAVMRQIGEAQAALHAVDGADFAFLPPFPPLLSASIQFHPFVSFLRSELARLQPALSSPAVSSASVLHGDLFLENVLFSTDGQLLALIDWEELCSGPRLLDAAMTVVGCCYTARQQLDEQLTTAFLSQYCSRHPLSAAECELLLDFVCYACLSIAFWRFRQFNVRVVDPARTGAYEQMVQRIERLRADGPDRQCVQRILQTLLRAAQPL